MNKVLINLLQLLRRRWRRRWRRHVSRSWLPVVVSTSYVTLWRQSRRRRPML